MTDCRLLADLVERLRDKAFKRCGPTIEAVHTKTDEWLAADAIENLMSVMTSQLTRKELSAAEMYCGGLSFKYAFSDVMKMRRDLVEGGND